MTAAASASSARNDAWVCAAALSLQNHRLSDRQTIQAQAWWDVEATLEPGLRRSVAADGHSEARGAMQSVAATRCDVRPCDVG
jgi:hypothetical protein